MKTMPLFPLSCLVRSVPLLAFLTLVSKLRLDNSTMLDPTCRPHVSDILSLTTLVPWKIGLDAHSHMFTSCLSDATRAAYPKEKGLNKKAYISRSTWKLVKLRHWIAGVLKRRSDGNVSTSRVR